MLNTDPYIVLILIMGQLFASKFCRWVTHLDKSQRRGSIADTIQALEGFKPEFKSWLFCFPADDMEQITDPLWMTKLSCDQGQLAFLLKCCCYGRLFIQQTFTEHHLCASQRDTNVKEIDEGFWSFVASSCTAVLGAGPSAWGLGGQRGGKRAGV